MVHLNSDRYLVADEVAEILRVSPKTIRDWRLKGQGPRSFKVGGRVLWRESEVKAFLGDEPGAATSVAPPSPVPDLARVEALLSEALRLLRGSGTTRG